MSEDPPEPEPSDGDATDGDRPALEEDEKAEFDPSGLDVDAIDEETAPADADGGDAMPDEVAPAPGEDVPNPNARTAGDLGVQGLTVLVAAIVENIDGEGATEDTVETVENVAHQFGLADDYDALAAEMRGKDSTLSPGEAAVANTAIVVAFALVVETDLADGALADGLEGVSA